MFGDPPPFQFSLRALMLAVAVVAAVCGGSMYARQPFLIPMFLFPLVGLAVWRILRIDSLGVMATVAAMEAILLSFYFLALHGIDLVSFAKQMIAIDEVKVAVLQMVGIVLVAVMAFVFAAWWSPSRRKSNAVAAVMALVLPTLWFLTLSMYMNRFQEERIAQRMPHLQQFIEDIEDMRLRLGHVPSNEPGYPPQRSELELEWSKYGRDWYPGFQKVDDKHYILDCRIDFFGCRYDSRKPELGWRRFVFYPDP